MIRPLGDRIMVQRLEGHGIETTTPGGIVIPATVQKNVQNRPDMFRARVVALGPDAERVLGAELQPGDEVLLYTYDGTRDRTFTGDDGGEGRLFIQPDDILCAVEPEEARPCKMNEVKLGELLRPLYPTRGLHE